MEGFGRNPAGVIFAMQFIAREARPLLFAVQLIVHPVPGKRFDCCAGRDVKVRVFIPTIGVEEEFAHVSGRLGRKFCRAELER